MSNETKEVVGFIPKLIDLPQCDATRRIVYSNDTPETDKRCLRRAKFKMGDENYCTRHAEILALQTLLNAGRMS